MSITVFVLFILSLAFYMLGRKLAPAPGCILFYLISIVFGVTEVALDINYLIK